MQASSRLGKPRQRPPYPTAMLSLSHGFSCRARHPQPSAVVQRSRPTGDEVDTFSSRSSVVDISTKSAHAPSVEPRRLALLSHFQTGALPEVGIQCFACLHALLNSVFLDVSIDCLEPLFVPSNLLFYNSFKQWEISEP